MRLQLAILFAKDIDRMAAFYSEVLGLPILAGKRGDRWIELDAGGGFKLGLHAIPSETAEGIEISSPPAAREETPIKLVFTVPDVEAECDRLRALGVHVILRPWGGCDALDPEGNVFQMAPEN